MPNTKPHEDILREFAKLSYEEMVKEFNKYAAMIEEKRKGK